MNRLSARDANVQIQTDQPVTSITRMRVCASSRHACLPYHEVEFVQAKSAWSKMSGEIPGQSNLALRSFVPTLKQLFYCYENSPVRLSGLKAIEELLHTPELRLKNNHWILAGFLTTDIEEGPTFSSLECEAKERGEAIAVGLSKVVQKYNFMMCDA